MNKTSSGLRERLFVALDSFIEKKISAKDVEGICYLSEQILKTAQVELEIQREFNENERRKRDHELVLKREEKKAMKLLQETLANAEDDEAF